MKNIMVQFDGDKYRVFQSTTQNELLGVAHSLDEVTKLLSDQFTTPGPKVGDEYWYVCFGEDFRSGGIAEVRSARISQAQVNYYNNYHQLPLNVYTSQNQAACVMQKVIAMFKDLRGKWEF